MPHTQEELEALTVADLKKILKDSDLSQTGKKSELIERILESEASAKVTEIQAETTEVSEEKQEENKEEDIPEFSASGQNEEDIPESSASGQNEEIFVEKKSEENEPLQISTEINEIQEENAVETPSRIKLKLKEKLEQKKTSLLTNILSTFKESRHLRIDNLQRPLKNSGFLDFLRSKSSLDYLGEENLWINMIKTHAYITLKSIEDAKLLKESITGLKYPELENNFNVLEVSYSEISVEECPNSLEAKKKPSEWKEFLLSREKEKENISTINNKRKRNDNNDYEENKQDNDENNEFNKKKFVKDIYYNSNQYDQIQFTQSSPYIPWCKVSSSIVEERLNKNN